MHSTEKRIELNEKLTCLYKVTVTGKGRRGKIAFASKTHLLQYLDLILWFCIQPKENKEEKKKKRRLFDEKVQENLNANCVREQYVFYLSYTIVAAG